MPLVDADRLAQMGEQPVAGRLRRRLDGNPARLQPLGRVRLGAERAREHLAAEADAEHGDALVDRLAQQFSLAAEVRQPRLVHDCIEPERHDPGEIAGAQPLQVAFPRVGRYERQAAVAYDAPEQPRPGSVGSCSIASIGFTGGA